MTNRELVEFLSNYDIYHSSVSVYSKVQICVNYKPNDDVEISMLKAFENKRVDKITYEFNNDFDFNTGVLPKIISRFLEINLETEIREIMGNSEYGNLFISRKDGIESLMIRNCSKKIMEMVLSLKKAIFNANAVNEQVDFNILTSKDENISKYINYNLALDYANYRLLFLDNAGKSNFFDFSTYKSFLEKENRGSESNLNNLVILDLTRYAIKMGLNSAKSGYYSLWEEIKKKYGSDTLVIELCDKFNTKSYDVDSVFVKALICAEFEKNNEKFILNNVPIIMEALDAANNGVIYCSDKFLEYWDGRKRYYNILGNNELVKICNDFFNSYRLINNDIEEKGDIQMEVKSKKRESLFTKIKEIKANNERPNFSSIINDPIVVKEEFSSGSLFVDNEHDKLAVGAKDQAERLMRALQENEQIKRDAEEFAKTILKEQRERKELIRAAEAQAKRIFDLEKENEELRRLAEDNARSIFKREEKYAAELKLREHKDDNPVSQGDIDKINYLLNALSAVKELDFAVNHPTVIQEIAILEEKIVTYLSTHTNIVAEQSNNIESANSTVDEKKTPTDLLATIRNVYTTSHIYEKEGRHTVINIVPVDDKYRVTLYSVKNNTDDVLTDVYFDAFYFNEDVIKELCEIYSLDAVIVASKTDNIPDGLADYLVIDNQDNAIKFMGCSKEIIEIAKAYL